MNTTMAPIAPALENSLEDLNRRHEILEDISLRRRKDGGGDGGGDGKNEIRSKDSSDDSDDSDGGGDGDGKKSKGDGPDGNQKKADGPPASGPPPPPPSQQTTTVVSLAPTTIWATATAAPTTVIVTMPASSLSAAAISSTTISISSTLTSTPILSSPTSISSRFPTTAAASVQPTFTPSADTSSQPRKGLNTDNDPSFTSAQPTTTSSSGSKPTTLPVGPNPESIVDSPSTTSLALPSHTGESQHHAKNQDKGNDKSKDQGLSPTAERVLISVGSIGAFVIVIGLVLLVLRMNKIDAFSKFRNRKVRKGGSRDNYGWRRNDEYATDAPPKYPGERNSYEYPSDMKSISPQKQADGYFTPIAMPPLAMAPLATPETAATLSLGNDPRQEQVRESLSNNAAPMGYSPSSQQGNMSTTQAFYNTTPQARNDLLTRQVSDANQTIRSQNTFASQQTSNLNDPYQREIGHMSFLSSLSSGFGDGLIIPDPTNPNSRQTQTFRQSQNPGAARFSWARSQGQRDTVYTTTSEESAPRFRTVNSWVAQQTGRVERDAQIANEIPNVPAIPMPLQVGLNQQPGLNHQRNISEDPVFKFHPGEEIQISRGSRVPSTILNKQTGIN